MPPDYSEFSARTASVTKVTAHKHPDGSTHIEIDAIFPPGTEEVAGILMKRFDEMMKNLPGAVMVTEEKYTGIEAELNDKPIAQVYEELRTKARDYFHEN